MEIPNIRLVIISTVIYLYMDSKKRNKKAWLSSKTLRWRIHNNPYIRPGDCLHKNEMTNWETIIVSMIALDCDVICMQSTNKARSYGCVPHKVIAITPPCQSYQFNPP
ncbi:hypothetical protein GLOIN_2v1482504 [Rhizophagus irregularis DAOM 181602=DAOM 197198]|nr:hypothetical protein GLOIN_2v1482504 [Rhizophagus irregularis DAOM 181602=DAOM 197198]